ncbi:MAG: amidohydrolase family protein [Sphaerochaetaceae bacterium]|nr:amidohydrolase family protein [Sphaerochaetaceae bacterium]
MKRREMAVAFVCVMVSLLLCSCVSGKDIVAIDHEPVGTNEVSAVPESAGEYRIVDSHLHCLDFLQRADGFGPLVEKMDEAGVSEAVLFGMAMSKRWDEHAPNKPACYLGNDSRAYYFSETDYIMLEQYEKESDAVQARFFPFVCGMNPNDRNAVEYISQLLDLYPGEIYGIGELMSRRDDLTALTYGEPTRTDHPAFLAIYDLAAEKGLPVLIHHNIAGAYMDDPIYLEELERALEHNRKTNIIWAHVGISRRVEISNLVEIADGLLEKHPNLHMDLSWVVYDDYINKNGGSLKEWAALLEKHQDRIMIGSDKVGNWGTCPGEITKCYPLLDLSSDAAARKVSHENILKLVRR